jgi:hypothetical protein
LLFRYSLFSFLKCLPASNLRLFRYPHLFHFDPVTIAIWLESFDLIIFSTLHRTIAYASSIHNNLHSHWLKYLYSF